MRRLLCAVLLLAALAAPCQARGYQYRVWTPNQRVQYRWHGRYVTIRYWIRTPYGVYYYWRTIRVR